MDAKSRWWFTELLAADCEKAWIHPGWEDTMQKWYKITKRTAWREGTQVLKKRRRCEVVKQRGKNGQSTGSVCKIWRISRGKRRIEEIRGSTTKAKGVLTGRGIETVQSKHRGRV